MTLPDIQTIVVILGGVVALIVAWRKSGPDLRKAYAEAADLYQHMAAEQAKTNQELSSRVEKLEKDVADLKDEKELDECFIQELSAYVDKLIEIMTAAGLQVPTRPARKVKTK